MINQISYERLSTNLLKIAQYQIPRLQMMRAKAIAKDFKPERLGVITVSYRDGQYWVVDGQHRLVAAKIAKYPDLMCEVVSGLTYEEEAYLFANQDENKKPVQLSVKWNSLRIAGHEETLKIDRIVESAGLELSTNGHKGKGQIIAISTVKSIHNQLGDEGLYNG